MSTVALAAAQRCGTRALAGREVRRVLSLWTQTILPPVLTAVLFLAVFGGALGDRIREIEGLPYLDFILPGLLVMTVASQTFVNNSTSLFQAKSEGYIEDVLTSPLRPWQLALAYMAGGLVRGFMAALAVALLAMPFVGRLERPGVAVAALLLTGLVFSLLGVITGIWAETFDQHSFVAGIVITPLALVGGVFYSARSLGEPWQTLTRFDPIYYLVDANAGWLYGSSRVAGLAVARRDGVRRGRGFCGRERAARSRLATEAVAAVMNGRAAVITDIHGNVPALDAALGRIEQLGVEDVYCGGDLVGYGPRPNDVCRTIEERGIPTIYGNYDYAIARDLDDCGCFYPTPKDREIGQGSVAWTLAHTDGRSKRFMRDLPFDLRFEFAGKRVRLVHGSPRKVNEYLLEDRAASTFERIARLAGCDILLFGHTRKPWVREYGGVLFVNCGSVGKPKDGDPRGSFGVLTVSDGAVSVSIERVEFDARAVAQEIREVGLPPELAEQLAHAA